jgi:hypothetical protein
LSSGKESKLDLLYSSVFNGQRSAREAMAYKVILVL